MPGIREVDVSTTEYKHAALAVPGDTGGMLDYSKMIEDPITPERVLQATAHANLNPLPSQPIDSGVIERAADPSHPFKQLASAAEIVIDTNRGGPKAVRVSRDKAVNMSTAVLYLAQELARLNRGRE